MSTRIALVVVVPTSAGDINMVENQLIKNQISSRGLTITTAEGYALDVELESVRELGRNTPEW